MLGRTSLDENTLVLECTSARFFVRSTFIVMRFNLLVLAGLVGLLCGCGGGGSNGGGGGGGSPQFALVSGNWKVPFSSSDSAPPTAWAGGALSQSGTSISGVFHVAGSPCFDPVADQLIMGGKLSTDPTGPGFTFSSAPIRGQVLQFAGDYVPPAIAIPRPTPPIPVAGLFGTWKISGGPCASSGTTDQVDLNNFGGSWGTPGEPDTIIMGPNWSGKWTSTLSQTGPDAQGFFHLSGNFNVSGSPCFTTGTIASSSVAGEISQITINMDSGQLVGSGASFEIVPGLGGPQRIFF